MARTKLHLDADTSVKVLYKSLIDLHAEGGGNIMTGKMENKVALVTGGNSGIGRATALAFAEAGARVVLAARRVPEGEETVDRIEKSGGSAIFIPTDVSKATDVEARLENPRLLARVSREIPALPSDGSTAQALDYLNSEFDEGRAGRLINRR